MDTSFDSPSPSVLDRIPSSSTTIKPNSPPELITSSYRGDLVYNAFSPIYDDMIDQLQASYLALKSVPRERIAILVLARTLSGSLRPPIMVRIAPTNEAWQLVCKDLKEGDVLGVSELEAEPAQPIHDTSPIASPPPSPSNKSEDNLDDPMTGIPLDALPVPPR